MPPLDQLSAEILTRPDEAEPFLTRVRNRIAGGPLRGEDRKLAMTIWGTIRWPRFLGWPTGTRMADGFSVVFYWLKIDGAVGQGGELINNSKPIKVRAPLVWDGPHDEENYRVSFMYVGLTKLYHQVVVDLRPEVEWAGTNPPWLPPARRIFYPQSLIPFGVFEREADVPTFLDDIVVRNAFY